MAKLSWEDKLSELYRARFPGELRCVSEAKLDSLKKYLFSKFDKSYQDQLSPEEAIQVLIELNRAK